jgi:hypothetical protein
MAPSSPDPETDPCVEQRSRLHLRIGWWALAAFIVVGIGLETLLGLRVPWYVDVASEPRRLMFRLAHAHGTLLSLVNVAYGLSLAATSRRRPLGPWASRAMLAANALVPLGFFAGGVVIHDGDPSLAILLVPLGALALLGGVMGLASTFSAR